VEFDRRGMMLSAAAAAACPSLAGAAIPTRSLSNKAASREAVQLYRYLWSLYGRRTLTGQQEHNTPRDGARQELDYIRKVTGKQPAILGLDYIEPTDHLGVNDRATGWHRSGGIVSLCWHWGAPDIGTGYENSKKDFDVAKALVPGTAQNIAMMSQMARVGDLLQALGRRRVPVLWRPFHEFSGDWFWWGKHGPAGFKALTHERGLNNLIWVLGWAGQNVDPRYYPGRDCVDVAGADIYVEDHGNLAPMFQQVKRIVGETVPICLHENGPIPDPGTLGPDSDWLWFMTWHTRWLTDPGQNTPDQLRAYYRSKRYVTKDEVSLGRP
jgi:mannan endo-1,4-beta-mannosidase